MDNKKELIIETFNSKFNLQKFINFTQELFKGNAKYKSNIEFSPKIKREFRDVVKEFSELGWYKDKDRKSMVIAVVRLETEDSVPRSRAIQRNFVKDYFLKSGSHSALVAFYNNNSEDWRLSFIKLDYSYKEAKLEEELTPAKRFSFLLGENEKHHTAISRFLPLISNDKEAPTIAEIEEAFNIEVVTKEFFEKYCDLYLEIKKCLDAQEGFNKIAKELDIRSDEFTKKLMGQLVFLYFLQKKGWLGVEANPIDITEIEASQLLENKTYDAVDAFEKVYELQDGKYIRNEIKVIQLNDEEITALNSIFINTKYDANWGSGDKDFIRSLYNKAVKEGKNFYNNYLEHVFYNALNNKRGGSTYFKELNCKIPFLNGGLFQPISENYEWEVPEFNIPNEVFSNKVKTKQGDIGTGVLDIFDRYAFTIKEDEPLEKEIAVDPEMLGKVFENLLDVVDRKKKGAFYTPRKIVHYMCQESLINYLITEVGIEYKDTEALIRYGDVLVDVDNTKEADKTGNFKMPEIIRRNARKIDNALANVKIADPAVGSGAFPLGMINEIIRARMNLDLYIYGDELALNKSFKLPRERQSYELKYHTIHRCIHAVDIERSAVDITKLRLWLSLVVDENDFRKVKSLPNLDYNIIVGNSLLEEFEGVKLFNEKLLEEKNNDDEKETAMEQIDFLNGKKDSENVLDEIYNLQEKFFSANSQDEKVELKKDIDKLEWTLIEKTVRENGREELLPKIKEFKRTNTKPYFLWKLNFAKVFREKGGFDIVIGNPPYVGEKGNKEIFRPIANSEFGERFYQGKMDLFYFFFHKGIDLSRQNGIISFITTNYFITATGGNRLREDFFKRTVVKKLINFNELKIFETALGQHNMITILRKDNNSQEITLNAIINRIGFANSDILSEIFSGNDECTDYYSIKQVNLYEGEHKYIRLNGITTNNTDSILQSILLKLKNTDYILGKVCDIKQGIVSGADKVTDSHINKYKCNWNKGTGIFVLSKQEVEALNLTEFELSLVKNFYKNSQVSQYKIQNNDNLYVLYITKDLKEDDIPNIINHLSKYKPILSDKRETKEGKLPWYCLHWPRDKYILESGFKIINPRRAKGNIFALETNKRYEQSDIMISVIKESYCKRIDVKYLLGFLNSKLCNIWLLNKGKMKGNLFELYGVPLSEIPIIIPSLNIQGQVSYVVNSILDIGNSENDNQVKINHNIDSYKKEIDYILYDLYNLTQDEIKFIEQL